MTLVERIKVEIIRVIPQQQISFRLKRREIKSFSLSLASLFLSVEFKRNDVCYVPLELRARRCSKNYASRVSLVVSEYGFDDRQWPRLTRELVVDH